MKTVPTTNILYNSSDIGGGASPMEFDLLPNNQRGLFSSYKNITIPPYALVAEVFDSIYITLKHTIKIYTRKREWLLEDKIVTE
ncbi:MAG: hypothetical protein LBR55_05500 [Bacteroidales bacterium]|jgi:hypothetical protein|nr:hypothetical protein [Bacteroidales bacterium]